MLDLEITYAFLEESGCVWGVSVRGDVSGPQAFHFLNPLSKSIHTTHQHHRRQHHQAHGIRDSLPM